MNKIIIMLLLISLLNSCASLNKQRQVYFSNNPDIPAAIKTAILESRIITGMNKEHVQMSWGKPDNVVVNLIKKGKEYEKWMYYQDYGDNINTYDIIFYNDQVEEVSHAGTRKFRNRSLRNNRHKRK